MERIIKAYSIEQAFQYLLKELENEGIKPSADPRFFMNLDNFRDADDRIIQLNGKGTIFGGITLKKSGENPNQTQTKVVNTKYPANHTKKWITVYLAVYDHPFGGDVVEDSETEKKQECVNIARSVSAKEKRDVFVIIGKKIAKVPRCTAQILYKPSPKQTLGEYKFVW